VDLQVPGHRVEEDAWAKLLHSMSPIVVYAKEAIGKKLTSSLDFPAVLVELVLMYDCPLERLDDSDAGSQDWFKSFLISNHFVVTDDVESVWKASEWRQKFQRCLSRKEVCEQERWLARVRGLPTGTTCVRKIFRAISDSSSIDLSAGDFCRLYPGCWLNDDLLDAYFYAITKRASKREGMLKVEGVSCFFYQAPDSSKRKFITSLLCKNIFKLHMLMFPVHVNSNHFILAVVNFPKKRIELYDSYRQSHQKILFDLLAFLIREAQEQSEKVDFSNWTMEHLTSPLQNNEVDCGVFACTTADYLAQGLDLDYTEDDVPLFRLKMVRDLSRGKLD
jgi:sentrin-specific protease 1